MNTELEKFLENPSEYDAVSLHLSCEGMTNEIVKQFAEGLKSNSTITDLFLGYNNIGDAGATAIAEALKSNSTITDFFLGYNNIGDAGATAIAEALKSNSTITNFNLFGNNIGDAGAAALAEALKSNSAITGLSLYDNNIGVAGTAAIAEALKSNSTIMHLNLYNNNIGDAGAAAIAEALKSNSAITGLSLCDNNIGDAGAAALAEALKSNSTITDLNLYNNNIGDAGATALAEALKSNSPITALHLNNNKIGEVGAAAIAEGLKINSTITAIYLRDNNIGDTGAAALAEALKSNSTITNLCLDNNNISAIVQTLQQQEGMSGYNLSTGNQQPDPQQNQDITEFNKFMAVFNNDVDAIETWLRDEDIDISAPDNLGRTMLWYAAFFGRDDILNLLLSETNEVNTKDGNGVSILEAAKLHPSSSDLIKTQTYLKLATSLQESGRPEEAIVNYLHAIKLDNELVGVYNKLGDLYKEQGEYKHAIMCYRVENKSKSVQDCFKKWMEQDPDNPDIMMMRGDHLKSTGQYSKAITHYNHAIDLGDNAQVKEASAKIANILSNQQDLSNEYLQMSETGSCLHAEMVTEDFLAVLSGEAENYEFA